MNSRPVAISRDSLPRDFQNEIRPIVDNSTKVESKAAPLTDCREFFKAVIPTTGKVLTQFLRDFKLSVLKKSD